MNVAFIPVRGGSKSIPLKNIKTICGKPLVYWTVKAANDCECIDLVYVATDSQVIGATVEKFGFNKVRVIERTAESATDTASTEFVMLEFAQKYEFDNIVLVQATSPLLKTGDLIRGFDAFNCDDVDSVLSVVCQKRFNWITDENGNAFPVNYDPYNRPRRQEFTGYLVENGAFYITSRKNLLKTKNRISGRIKTVEMSEDTFFEIDEPSDWEIIEALMLKNKISENINVSEIKMLLTDCDGCLTDGGMYYSEKGDELKKFNTRDGMGFKLLKQQGIVTGIVTSEAVELNQRRAEKLKLNEMISGGGDKAAAIIMLCNKYQIGLENVAYIGDDINDIEAINMVGFGCCPSDAMPAVKKVAKFVTNARGGEGVVREVVEKLINEKLGK